MAKRFPAPIFTLKEYQGLQSVQRYIAIHQRLLKEKGQRATGKKTQLIIRIAVTLLLFAFLFRSLSWSMLWTILARADGVTMLLGLTVGAVGVVVSSSQWQSLLHAERITIGISRLIRLYLVGIAFSHFLPTSMGGDAVKALYVGCESGNGAGSVSAVAMSRITGFFGMLLVALPVLIIWLPYFTYTIIVWFVVLSLLVGGMMWAAILSTTLVSRASTRGRWVKNHLASHRILASVVRIGNAISMSTRRPRSLCVALVFGVLFWVIGDLNYYVYGIALHVDVPLYFYFVAIPLVSLVTVLPISINGFGVRESAFVYIFSTVHVPPAKSLLLAFVMDAQILFLGIIGGYMYLTMSSRTNPSEVKKQSEHVEGKRSMMNEHNQSDSGTSQFGTDLSLEELMPQVNNLRSQTASQVPVTEPEASQFDPDMALVEEPTEPMKAIRSRTPSQVSEPEVQQEALASQPITLPIDTHQNISTTSLPYSKKRRKKTWVVVISSVICLLVLLGATGGAYLFTQAVPKVTLYRIGVQQNVSQFVGGGGIVFPYQQINVSYPASERVTAVLVKTGDQVSANQPLIQLDATQLNADVAQAAADLAAARAYLYSVIAIGNPVAIAQARQAYTVAKDKYDALVATATSSPILNNDSLVSPINGVVTSVNVNPGDVFAGNAVLVTIMDESKVIVHVQVPLSNLGQIHPGLTAVVTPSALPNLNFPGTVSTVIPTASAQTDTFEVWVSVNNPNKVLLSGMSAFVRIQYAGKVLVVPRLAVLNPDNDSVVFVVRHQHAYIQHVHIVGRSVDSIYINSSISPGDMIVLVGLNSLRDGQEVRVTHIEGPAA